VERGEPLRMARLEQRVAQLEREKTALDAALSTSQAETETALKATRQEAEAAKEETVEARLQVDAKKKELEETECKHQAMCPAINAYREAIRAGAEPLQIEVDELLEKLGLVAPDLSPNAPTISISELFRWLRACVAMANSGSWAMGDLSAVVAVRSLSAAICRLLPAGGGADAAFTKAQLWSMRNATFEWPPPEEVRPDALPLLPKNIARNFTVTFFKDKRANPRPDRSRATEISGT